MELVGYVVETAALPTPMQIARLRAFCRSEKQILVDVCVEKAADAAAPLLHRPPPSRPPSPDATISRTPRGPTRAPPALPHVTDFVILITFTTASSRRAASPNLGFSLG